MAEEIWAREFREGWIDDIELVKKPGVYFGVEVNCSAQMEDRWFGTGSGTIWGGGQKHFGRLKRNRWRRGKESGKGGKGLKGR